MSQLRKGTQRSQRNRTWNMASPPPRCHDIYQPFAVCVAGQSSSNQDGIYHVRLPGRGLEVAISQGSLQRRVTGLCSSFPTAPNLFHLCLRLPSLSLHQHNSPAKLRTQEALRASTTNWSSSISLFLKVSLFPYHALFVRFKAFPLCFFPGSSKRERGGASETIALLSHWRPLSSPPPSLAPPGLEGFCNAGRLNAWGLQLSFQGKIHLLSILGGAFKWPLGHRVTSHQVPPLSPLHRCLCWR